MAKILRNTHLLSTTGLLITRTSTAGTNNSPHRAHVDYEARAGDAG